MNARHEKFWDDFSPGAPELTSLTLIERAKGGHPPSCELLCRLYGRVVWTVYLAKVPEQDRMDLWQEVFKTVFQRIHTFHKGSFEGPLFRIWLRQIAFHKIGNYIKGRRRNGFSLSDANLEVMMVADLGQSFGSATLELDERTELVRSAFETASATFEPRTLEAIRRVTFGDESATLVAEALGMSANAICSAKSRMLTRIRAILKDLGEPVGLPAGP